MRIRTALMNLALAAAVASTAATGSARAASAGVAAAKPKPAAKAAFKTATLIIGHRVFPAFREEAQATLNREFPIGDSEYTGKIVQYVPDFYMDVKSRKIASRGNEPNNPAFKIIVRQNKVPQDTSWAFLKSPPHFARRSMLSFQIARIEFPDRPPLVRADSLAASAAVPPAENPHGMPPAAANPHGAATPANPHAKPTTIPMTPAHGTGSGTAGH